MKPSTTPTEASDYATLPNKALEDDGDKRVFFGLRSLSRELLPDTASGSSTSFSAPPAPEPSPHSGFPHRASPLTFAGKDYFSKRITAIVTFLNTKEYCAGLPRTAFEPNADR